MYVLVYFYSLDGDSIPFQSSPRDVNKFVTRRWPFVSRYARTSVLRAVSKIGTLQYGFGEEWKQSARQTTETRVQEAQLSSPTRTGVRDSTCLRQKSPLWIIAKGRPV